MTAVGQRLPHKYYPRLRYAAVDEKSWTGTHVFLARSLGVLSLVLTGSPVDFHRLGDASCNPESSLECRL